MLLSPQFTHHFVYKLRPFRQNLPHIKINCWQQPVSFESSKVKKNKKDAILTNIASMTTFELWQVLSPHPIFWTHAISTSTPIVKSNILDFANFVEFWRFVLFLFHKSKCLKCLKKYKILKSGSAELHSNYCREYFTLKHLLQRILQKP